MKKNGYDVARPHCDASTLEAAPLMSLSSGYVQRAKHIFPQSSARYPWQARQKSLIDSLSFPFDKVAQEMEFSKTPPAAVKTVA